MIESQCGPIVLRVQDMISTLDTMPDLVDPAKVKTVSEGRIPIHLNEKAIVDSAGREKRSMVTPNVDAAGYSGAVLYRMLEKTGRMRNG